MIINADLHVHSKYSRATSKNLNLNNVEQYARQKGLSILGTGDFTHPLWLKELQKLKNDKGILYSKTNFPFLLQTEISLIFTDKILNKGKKIHLVVLAPSIDVVKQINAKLLTFGRLDYDGRPIFKIQPDDFVYYLKEISDDIEIIPAHIWTPFFSLFGSQSGYDYIKDCFKDQIKNIHALETGLSSDPMMNWQVSQLDDFNLVSFSDAHSFWPWRLGRESTLINVNGLSYDNVIKAIRNKDDNKSRNKISATLEFWPEEGKYHYDGHRLCKESFNPEETKKINGICPKCNRNLTLGVSYRVDKLSDRDYGYIPKNAKPFINLISLSKLISYAVKTNVTSKKVMEIYNKLIQRFDNEINILLTVSKKDLINFITLNNINMMVAKVILDSREFNMSFKPGFDGEYGIIDSSHDYKDKYNLIKTKYFKSDDVKSVMSKSITKLNKNLDLLKNSIKKSD